MVNYKEGKIRKLVLIFTNLLSYLNKIIPKDKKQILFYDSGRDYLDDNTEAFYSWMKSNSYDKNYKMICCVPNEKKHNNILNYKPVGIIKGVWYYLRSKYVFFSFGDFRIKPANNQIVINQWHGTPLKSIGKLTQDQNYLNEKLDNFTYLLVSSEYFVPIMQKAFGCDKNKIKICGQARVDYFFSEKKVKEILNLSDQTYQKYILWMPTFRESKDGRFKENSNIETETGLPIFCKTNNLSKLNDYLKEKQILLVIKIHPYAKIGSYNTELTLSNIKVLNNENIISKGVKLYEFVKEFDALLTDYSSIFCDYIILNRPIAFTLDDYHSYEDKRGFVFEDITKYMPGYHLYNEQDMYEFIDDIAIDKDRYKEKRIALLPLFCKYTDGNNCERLAKEVGITK